MIQLKKSRWFACVALGLALACTACSPTVEQSGTDKPYIYTSSPWDALPPLPGQVRRLQSAGTAGYYGSEVYQGNPVATYINFSSRRRGILCGVPGCRHADRTCPAYALMADHPGTKIFVWQDRLVLLENAYGRQRDAWIYMAKPDGSGRRLLCDFYDGGILGDALFADDLHFYALRQKLGTKEEPGCYQLIRIDPETGWIDTLETFPNTEGLALVAGFDQSLVLCQARSRLTREMMVYDLEAGTLEDAAMVVLHSADDILAEGSLVCTVRGGKEKLEFLDLGTGETTTLSYAQLVEQDFETEPEVSVCHVADEWFRLDFSDGGQAATYLANAATGELCRNDLLCGYDGAPVAVMAQWEDDLLVQQDWQPETGDGQAGQLAPVYALISRRDYLAGKPNYRTIDAMPQR